MSVGTVDEKWGDLRDKVSEAVKKIIDESGIVTVISAGHLRSMGVPIQESIPDCATVPSSAVHFGVDAGTDDEKLAQGIAEFKIRCVVDEPFEWVEFKTQLKEKVDG